MPKSRDHANCFTIEDSRASRGNEDVTTAFELIIVAKVAEDRRRKRQNS